MARRCICRGLAATMLQDPRMRLLPLATRALWLLLADALAALPEPGVFRIAGRAGSVREVALLVSVSGTDDETHLETQLETLIETGLLNRLEDGALALPSAPAAADRSAAANRRNGAAGGRPRRNETPEAARLRRAQGGMLLPVRGGLDANPETQTETHLDETPRAAAAACLESTKPAAAASVTARGTDETLQLADKVADLAGMDAARSMHDARPVLSWLADGIAPDLICEVVAGVAARRNYTPPRSLVYFDGAVRQAAALARPVTASAPADPARAAAARAYAEAFEAWRANGRPGAPPAPPDCLRREAA